MLRSALSRHSSILCFGELLHSEQICRTADHDTHKRWLSWRNENPIPFVRDMVFRGYPESTRAVGFKIFPEHLDNKVGMGVLWDWLEGQRVIAVISLHRVNLLAYFLSLQIAQRTKTWLPRPDERLEGAGARETVSIDPGQAEAAFERRLRYRRLVQERFSQHPFFELSYEELAENTQPTLGRVQLFLGVKRQALAPATLKQEVRPLREAISNYDELVRRWRGTRWECFLSG